MKRRDFLTQTSLLLGSTLLPVSGLLQASTAIPALKTADWKGLRQQFTLTHNYIHLATFLLASHPKPVAAAIERHRKAFDENPADYWHEHFMTIDHQIAAVAAEYMGGEAWQIALTDSTTMGWSEMKGVKLYTPMSAELSSGLVCFEV